MPSKVIVMGMIFDEGSVPDFGSIYLVRMRQNNVNDYGAEDVSDAANLSNITNAAPGSTCLFSNGEIYRLEKSGWAKFGDATESTASLNANANSVSPSVSPNFAPVTLDRDILAESLTDGFSEAPSVSITADSLSAAQTSDEAQTGDPDTIQGYTDENTPDMTDDNGGETS